MNREQKIALIIGFAVILVVGVLVSDHWSQARRVELADATEGVGDVLQGRPVASLPSPVFTQAAPVQYAEQNQARADRGLAEAGPQPAADPVAGLQPEDRPQEVFQLAQGRSDSPLAAAMSNQRSTEPGRGWLDNLSGFSRQLAGGGGLPGAARLEGGSGGPAPGVGGREAETPVAVEPQPIRHTVQKNETLFAIAKKYYGDGNKWKRIADANPGVVKAGGHIEPGVVLVVPEAGVDVQQRPATPEQKPASPIRETRLANAASPAQYTVRKHDTLGEISQRLLGTSKRLEEILAANRGKIDDPDDIRVGMVLNIPRK